MEREPESRLSHHPWFPNGVHSGVHWSATPHNDSVEGDDEDDLAVEGSDLRIMWDTGAGPLWGDQGLLPDEPEWLQGALGLSEPLINDLARWHSEMHELHYGSPPVDSWREIEQTLDRQAHQLAARLQAEVGDRFRVRYDRQ